MGEQVNGLKFFYQTLEIVFNMCYNGIIVQIYGGTAVKKALKLVIVIGTVSSIVTAAAFFLLMYYNRYIKMSYIDVN